MKNRTVSPNSESGGKVSASAVVDLAIVLTVLTLGFLVLPVLNPILRHAHNLLTVLGAAAFQLLVEGVAPCALMAVRGESFSSYGLIRHNIGRSLALALLLVLFYDAAFFWHTGALLWIPLRRQPAVIGALSIGFPLGIIGLTSALLAWGFTEGFFGIYFAKKVTLALGHSGAGWFAPGVLAFALFNGVFHVIVGQGLQGFIFSFASGYAIAVIPAVTGNAWGGTLVQTLTNSIGRL